MNIAYKKKSKAIIPTVEISDDDIPRAVELKAIMQMEGWKVFEKLYKEMEEEMQSSALAAVMLKENDREVTLKTAALLGLKACFGMAERYVNDVEDMVKNSQEVDNDSEYEDDGQA